MPVPSDDQQPRWTLPPLILHPFSGPSGPDKIVESSRANHRSEEELHRKLYEGRYQEVRMLFYVGKDLERWMEQCQDYISRIPELEGRDIQPISFVDMLVHRAPRHIVDKLKGWGVVNHAALFSRAVGLRGVFQDMPPIYLLSQEFLLNYYRYADHMFSCRLKLAPFSAIEPKDFQFELFASREYSQLLEEQWKQGKL